MIGVDLDEAFLHCAKAFIRSALWEPAAWPARAGLARPAQIWKDHIGMPEPIEEVEDMARRTTTRTISRHALGVRT